MTMNNYFKHKTVWLSLLAVIAVMAAIFFFSAQTEDESSDTSGVLVKLYIELFVPDFNEMDEGEQAASLHRITHMIRKLAHFTEYAVLGLFLTLHIGQLRQKLDCKAGLWWSIIIGVLYAASDEFHQYFVPGRSPGIKDICIDSLGILSGFVIMFCIMETKRKFSK